MTFLEQQKAYAELEPAWSGALERSGQAPGLSRYIGRSSLYQSPSWERLDTVARGECKGTTAPTDALKKPPIKGRSMDGPIGDRLKAGYSYGVIANQLNVSIGAIRRVCKELGIDRSGRRGTGGWAVCR